MNVTTENTTAVSTDMVRLEHLSKTFPGGTQAVNDLSVSVPEGEVFTMLGPSGCGKTTTLRMVAGLESPDTGSIHFRDDTIVDVDRGVWIPPNKRNVGMVFQSYAIWPHMTVEENVNYPLKLRGVPKAEARDRVRSILELVGLGGLEKRQAPLLSGGQQQRVALARALVYEPSVLLLDEPFSNLDTKLREQMRMEVKILQNRLKITVVFVTHDQVEALSLSDRIMVMNLGVPQQVGGPKDLYEDPANPFVRDFLGKTVLLHGTVQTLNQEGQVAVAVDGAANCILFGRTYSTADFNPGDAAYMAMRPEDVEVVPAEGAKVPDGNIGGSVEAALFVGERMEYRIKVNEQTSILVYGERHQSVKDGQNVYLKFQPASMSVWKA
jgi:ABC-type Fe3+/spermidine/putrescine transport system ATPase subunit